MPRYTRLALSSLPLLLLLQFAQADSSGKWVNGEEIYQKVCAYCHENGVSPRLLGRQFPAEVTQFMVRNGSRAMPAFKASFIDDAALKAVSDYIYNSKEAAPKPPSNPSSAGSPLSTAQPETSVATLPSTSLAKE